MKDGAKHMTNPEWPCIKGLRNMEHIVPDIQEAKKELFFNSTWGGSVPCRAKLGDVE